MTPLGDGPSTRVVTRTTIAAAAFALGTFVVSSLEPFPRLRFAIQRTPADLPSSVLAPADQVALGHPLLSIQIDDASLFDDETGLLANIQARGRDWERPASVSYYAGGQLQFAGGAGLRIHGGLTRTMSATKSFRLYFRREYGGDRMWPGVLFGGAVDPIRRLVVHNDVREDRSGRAWHFINPLAYDITRRVGALAPSTQPVTLFLNGEWQGVYVLTEHVRDNMIPELLVPRFGHADFAANNQSYRDLSAWVNRLDEIRMDRVAERVDVENLTRWFLAVLFCGTEDAFQGAQLLDRSDPEGRWFWINWDMDHSFMDYNLRAAVPWEHDTFETTLERLGEPAQGWRDSEVRSRLLTTLLAEDAAYREYFKEVFVDALNHRVTSEYLRERFAHYATLGRQLGLGDAELGYLALLEEYLERRPAIVREQAEVYLNTEPSRRVTVRGLGAGRGQVDGYAVGATFTGYYFPGMMVTLSANPDEGFQHWWVDGSAVNAVELRWEVNEDLDIEAVFDWSPTRS